MIVAVVVDRAVPVDPDDAGLGIDLHLGDVAAVRIGHRLAGEFLRRVEAGLAFVGAEPGFAGDPRYVQEVEGAVGPGDAEPAIGEFDVGVGGL